MTIRVMDEPVCRSTSTNSSELKLVEEGCLLRRFFLKRIAAPPPDPMHRGT